MEINVKIKSTGQVIPLVDLRDQVIEAEIRGKTSFKYNNKNIGIMASESTDKSKTIFIEVL